MRAKTGYTSMTHNPKFSGVLFVVITFICLPLLYFATSRIPQWTSYHQFADVRTIWGIPNFWNVVSNAPFFLVSILGFLSLKRQWRTHHIMGKEVVVFFILFLGIFLIGMGSAYYHWAPDNNSLVWDRIPITIVFMALLSLTVMGRINTNFGFWLLIPLILFGTFSVLHWHWTELSGQGDLRFYGLVQFYSMFLIIFTLILFPKPYPPNKAYLWMFVFYILAKICENFDWIIFGWGEIVSGHTLKHLFAAISTYFIIVILNKKRDSSPY